MRIVPFLFLGVLGLAFSWGGAPVPPTPPHIFVSASGLHGKSKENQWKTDALDACLMVHGSWLKDHGSWPREAREAHGSWPDAAPALVTQRRAGPDPDRKRASGSPGPGRHLAMSHELPLTSLSHEP